MGPTLRRWALHLALVAVLGLLLLPVGGLAASSGLPTPPRHVDVTPSAARADQAVSSPATSSVPRTHPSPAITGAYDWDPQPLNLFSPFPVDQVGGLGAVMAASDPLRSGVMFGGQGLQGLTNITITFSQATGLWDTRPVVGAPTPRANLSLATMPGGKFAVAFGGVVNLSTGRCDNLTFVFDFRNRSWVNRSGAIAPPPREGAAFAVDASRNVAILEGGRDRDYRVGGSGAYVFWNDTWLLNLSTFRWSRASTTVAPPPMFGSSMVWVPQTDSFLLFGGCATFCTNQLYNYTVGGTWTAAVQTGDIPAPRGAASEAWVSTWNITMLSGGFVWGNNTYVPLGDTFIFTPAIHQWDIVGSAGGPTPRFGSAAAALNANQCPGLFLVGGSTAWSPPPADGWFLDQNPDIDFGCNIWGGDESGGSTGGGGVGNCPVGSNTSALSVRVLDRATGLGIVGAKVNITGYCSLQLFTTVGGYANFTNLPNETVRILTTFPTYHLNVTYARLPVPTNRLIVEMDRYPALTVRTVATYANLGVVALPGILVLFQSTLGPSVLGTTDANGYLRFPVFQGAEGPTTFTAAAAGYANATAVGVVPFTGRVNVTIDLLSYGGFDVHVLRDPNGPSIGGAGGTIVPVGNAAFGSPIPFVTGPNGWFNVSLPLSNYTVFASAAGFLPNHTALPVAHGWVNATIVPIPLLLLYGANVSVRLVDSVTHLPIAGGNVTIGSRRPSVTGPLGWANFTNLRPPGRAEILGQADGYFNNSTAVDLEYRGAFPDVRLDLVPMTGCAPNCPPPTNGTPAVSPFRLLPSGGIALELFFLAPVLLAAAGTAYALYLRRSPSPRSI
ncbi:MAG: hypothetical protein L3K15_01725 [Thermoplasmata archaeon]|nr:hypothetical protein [Thermoplasmata archaeon]